MPDQVYPTHPVCHRTQDVTYHVLLIWIRSIIGVNVSNFDFDPRLLLDTKALSDPTDGKDGPTGGRLEPCLIPGKS